MKSPRTVAIAGIAALAMVGALSACTSAGSDSGKTEIRVATFPPGADEAAYTAFAEQEAQFEKANPDIDVIGVEYEWEGPTFAVQLAGGSLPDVFTVPFTDSKTLLENGQLTDVTDEVEELGYADKFNPVMLEGVTDSDGRIFGFPRQAYAMGLHYNRTLFEAGRARPRQPAHDLGRGARGREDDLREDRQGGLHGDDAEQHRRLAAHRGDRRSRRVDPGGQRRRHLHVDDRQRRHEVGARVPADAAVGGQLSRLELPARLGNHQPGVRRRQHRHVLVGFRRVHRPCARLLAEPRRLRPHGGAGRGRRRHARRR